MDKQRRTHTKINGGIGITLGGDISYPTIIPASKQINKNCQQFCNPYLKLLPNLKTKNQQQFRQPWNGDPHFFFEKKASIRSRDGGVLLSFYCTIYCCCFAKFKCTLEIIQKIVGFLFGPPNSEKETKEPAPYGRFVCCLFYFVFVCEHSILYSKT